MNEAVYAVYKVVDNFGRVRFFTPSRLRHVLNWPTKNLPNQGAQDGMTWERVLGGMTMDQVVQFEADNPQDAQPTPRYL